MDTYARYNWLCWKEVGSHIRAITEIKLSWHGFKSKERRITGFISEIYKYSIVSSVTNGIHVSNWHVSNSHFLLVRGQMWDSDPDF